jgi:hypothetical protein
MFFIEPSGGLANRLRALDSAIAFSQEKHRNLNVVWLQNPYCNCRFRDLFLVPPQFNRLYELKSKTLIRMLGKFVDVYFSSTQNHLLDHHRIKGLMEKAGTYMDGIRDYLDQVPGHGSIYIQAYNRFYDSPSVVPFGSFILKRSLQDKVDSYQDPDMVGVHIRRADHTLSIMYSPIELFIACMQKEVHQDGKVRFFVATDDPASEALLKEVFPNRIVTHPKRSLNRNDPIAIQDAAIDLYCLANCRRLIGSYWSSFSDVASEINGIDKVIVVAGDGKIDNRPYKFSGL